MVLTFKDRYLEMKGNGLTDYEIAAEMGVSRDTVWRWKKKYEVKEPNRIRKNKNNVSEKVLQAGEKNGISRRLLLRRIREYGYTEYQAVHTPKKNRRGDLRNKYDKAFDKSERQKWYYQTKVKGKSQ